MDSGKEKSDKTVAQSSPAAAAGQSSSTAAVQSPSAAAAGQSSSAAAGTENPGKTVAQPSSTAAGQSSSTAAAQPSSTAAVQSPSVAADVNPVSAEDSEAAADNIQLLPGSHWTAANLLPDDDDDDDDADSSMGSDAASSTASITSSVMAYRTIVGRTFHSERGNAAYWAPNDDLHMEAMNIVYHFTLMCMDGKLFFAPLEEKKLKKAIDIGTGTGIWAIDFADEFPNCEIIGTDISPTQPTWVPPNLMFEIDNCAETWTFDDNTFDYVHIRNLYGSIKDWEFLFDEAYRVCKPGGWIESHEASAKLESDDGSIPKMSAMDSWGEFFISGGRKLGQTFEVIADEIQIKNFKRLGMEEVGIWNFKTPLSGWPKDKHLSDIGRVCQLALEHASGWVTYFASAEGYSKEQVEAYCAQLKRELKKPKVHGYFRQKAVWGRKPMKE